MSVSSIECAYDLLECQPLIPSLCKFLAELKAIYDCCARTIQFDPKRKMKGWYPLDQRDKTTTSWITALSLGFIKDFCKVLSCKINDVAKDSFRLNYRPVDRGWNDLYDASAVKSKLRLMFEEKGKHKYPTSKRIAILFGPPGTGKRRAGSIWGS